MGSSTAAPSSRFERLVGTLSEVGGLPSGEAGKGRRLGHFALGTAIVAAAIIGTIVGVAHAVAHLSIDPLADVETYYLGGQRLNLGMPLYPADADPDVLPYYRYPPLLAIAMRPFALLPYPLFAILWEAGTILAFVFFVRRIGLSRRNLLALGILGNSIGDVLPIGQAQMHVTTLLALGQPWSIALAGQLKVFPALVALYWVGRGDWRSFVRFLEWTVAFVVLQFVLAPGAMIDYGQTLTLSQVGDAGNLSPYQWSRPLWLFLVIGLAFVTVLVARTRFGWAVAVAYSSLVYPRLFGYHLLSLGAALKSPDDQPAREPTRRPRGSG